MRRLFVALIATLLCLGCRESMGPRVAHEEDNPSQEYEALLAEVVTPDGYVDYDRLQQTRGPLDAYVAWMANSRAWTLERHVDRPVDYLNAYNALVLYQVLERGRPESVQTPRGFLPIAGAKFFSGTQFKLGTEWLSLTEIEHERIRNMLLDHRLHAALNNGASSSPPMRRELYHRRKLNHQLRDQMVRWLMSDNGVRFEDDGTMLVSPIFEWYANDFAFYSAGETLCEILAAHTHGARKRRVLDVKVKGCPHGTFEYDWSLNHRSMD